MISDIRNPTVKTQNGLDESQVNFIPIQQKFKHLDRAPQSSELYVVNNTLIWIEKDSLLAYTLDYENFTCEKKFVKPLKGTFKKQYQFYTKLIFVKNTQQLFAFGNNRYCEVDISSGEFFNCHDLPLKKSKPKPFLVDSKNTIWIEIQGIGLCILNPSNHILKEIRNKRFPDVNFYANQGVNSMYEDRNKNVWFTTNAGGVFKYNLSKSKFKFLPNEMGIPLTLRNGNILYKEADRFTSFNLTTESLKTLFRRPIDTPGSLTLIIEFEDNGNLYVLDGNKPVVTNEENYFPIIEYNSKGDTINKYNESIAREFRLRQHIFHEDNRRWTALDMYYSFSDNHTFKIFSENLDLTDLKIEAEYNSLWELEDLTHKFISNDSIIWCSFMNGGIIRYDRKNKQWKQYGDYNNSKVKISSNKIYTMLIDPIYPDSIIWVGHDSGVDRLNHIENKVTNLSIRNGLPNNIIYGILPDNRSNLWMSSNNGLFVLDPRNNKVIKTFDVSDGIQHTEFNKFEYGKNQQNMMFFGGIGGLSYFNPDDFYDTQPTSKLIFTKMLLGNKEVSISRKQDIVDGEFKLETALEYGPPIKLSYDERVIAFEFALLDFTNPPKNKYKYRLLGESNNWIELGSQNKILLTNLDHGEYTLHVQAIGSNSNWKSQEAYLQFTILPPWWETWWFRLFTFLTIGIIIYSYFRNKRMQREKMLALRNRISRDLHDEIGSTLSSISLFGTVAKREMRQKTNMTSKMLTKINESAISVMESLNDIVWTISSDNDKVRFLVNRMRAYSSEINETNEWQIEFKCKDEDLDASLSMLHRRNTYFIFKECINNAVKYSKGHIIKVDISFHKDLFNMTITDDGIGFNLEDIDFRNSLGGNGIKNMKNRTNEIKGKLKISSSKDVGTIITLTFDPKIQIKY